MQQAAVANHVTSSVNTGKLIESMRAFFSTSKVVLAECMQNSRRAGASAVWFSWEDATLVIADDGCGIADFSKLVTLADSGWSQDVQDEDQPFGVGFFSVAFAAEKVQVESQGKQIIFTSDDLTHQRKIGIKPSSFIGGARITLHGCHLTEACLQYDLKNFAQGFPIPVFFQGRELERPHAKTNLQGVETADGFIAIYHIHSNDSAEIPFFQYRANMLRGLVYCQGLPIKAGRFTGNSCENTGTVIHINHKKYIPRLPDRDCFVDSDAVSDRLEDLVQEQWREFLVAQKQKLSANEFVSKYWNISRAASCFDLMEDVPVLPNYIAKRIVGKAVMDYERGGFYRWCVDAIKQEDVEDGNVALFKYTPSPNRAIDFARLEWAKEEECIFVDVANLPQHHWVHGYIQDLEEDGVTIVGKAMASESFEGHYVSGSITIVKDLAITIRGITHKVTSPILEVPDEVTDTEVESYNADFLVPDVENAYGYGDALLQASYYYDENENFAQAEHNADEVEFENIVAILKGETPADTLKKVLENGNVRSKTNLRSITLSVQFDEKGNVTIV